MAYTLSGLARAIARRALADLIRQGYDRWQAMEYVKGEVEKQTGRRHFYQIHKYSRDWKEYRQLVEKRPQWEYIGRGQVPSRGFFSQSANILQRPYTVHGRPYGWDWQRQQWVYYEHPVTVGAERPLTPEDYVREWEASHGYYVHERYPNVTWQGMDILEGLVSD